MTIQSKVFVLAAMFIFICSASLQAAEDPDFEKAVSFANKGQFDMAAAFLRRNLKKDPDRRRLRYLLGNILDHIGKPELAVTAWEQGLRDKPEDYGFLMAMAHIRKRQGKDGPNVSYEKGMVSYEPSKDEKAENEYKLKHLKMAITIYVKAAKAAPDSKEPLLQRAEILMGLKEFDDAIKIFSALVKKNANDGDALQSLAKTLVAAGKKDEAVKQYQALLKLDPRHALAHQFMATHYEAKEDKEKAKAHRMQFEFFNWLAPFTTMAFNKQHFEIYKILAARKKEDIATLKTFADSRPAAVDKLIAKGDASSLEFLATLCFHHGDHGTLENKVYAGMVKSGLPAVPILKALLKASESTCTMKHVTFALVEIKAPGAFEAIVPLLPGDLRPMWSINVADALAKLGDERAVEPLVELLATEVKTPKAALDQPLMMNAGRQLARVRAALALGSFDTEASKIALEKGIKNEQIAPACHVAMYKLTKDEKHLKAVRVTLLKNEYQGVYLLAKCMLRMNDEKAKKEAEVWRQARIKEQEKEKEKEGE